MLKVLLAEDHHIVRKGIRMLLETDQEINIVGEAMNGTEVLKQLGDIKKIDVVLTDINMPEMDGIALLKALKVIDAGIHVVMFSMHDHEKYVAQAFMAGVSGYLLKNISADELIFCLKHVNNGGKYLCAELSMRLLNRIAQYDDDMAIPEITLSEREMEILRLIAEGFTNQEMSEKLFISRRTVEGHRQCLIDKTETRNTASLIRYAVLNGLV